jgi:hypothetical protein
MVVSRTRSPVFWELYQILSVYPRFVGALHCNAPYEVSILNRVSVLNRDFVSWIRYYLASGDGGVSSTVRVLLGQK